MAPNEHEAEWVHQPVLLAEVVHWLRPEAGGTFVDCTLGLGGHAEALLRSSPLTRVVGIDRDPQAISLSTARLAERFPNRFQAVHANFREVGAVLQHLQVSSADGVVADLGASSMQLDQPERGFSFQHHAALDMRMDPTRGETAAQLISRLNETELANLIFELGEERGARRIARAIVRARQREPIHTTLQLADIVVRALRTPGRWRIHPATRTFQALRIAINEELRDLERFIPDAISVLAKGGRLAVISFHSLEDRIVKRAFLRDSGHCICRIRGEAGSSPEDPHGLICMRCGASRRVDVLTRKPIRASAEEVALNPRARSARLRIVERV